jgi:hypothetical protein
LVELNLRHMDHLLTQYVDDFYGEAGRGCGGDLVVAGDEVVFLLGGVGWGDVKDLAVVGGDEILEIDDHLSMVETGRG